MTKYKPLQIVAGPSYEIKPIILSDQQKTQLRILIGNLIHAVVQNIENEKKSGILEKQENLYIIRKVGPINYHSHGVSSGYMMKRITKKDWITAIVQSKQNAKKLIEYEALVNFFTPILTEGQKHYPIVLTDYVVDEYFKNKLNTVTISKIKDIFLKDLLLKHLTAYAKVEIFGIQLKSKRIQISKKLHIDQVSTKDLDFEKPLSLGENLDRPFPGVDPSLGEHFLHEIV